MKVVKFLKRVGIAAIPILAVVILMLCFNIASMLSFNTHYPDKLSQKLFATNTLSMYWFFASIVASFWVFFKLMDWARAKIRQMNTETPEADEQQNDHGDNDNRKPNGIDKSFRISYQWQTWYHVNRVLISMVLYRNVYGSCQLDMPKPHEKETEPFWQDCDVFLYALYVDTYARNHSIAKNMLAAAESVCQYEDCKTIGLRWDDRESESWVLDWYKRMGYEEIRVESDGHARFLVKDLTKDVDKKPSSDSAKKDDATEE